MGAAVGAAVGATGGAAAGAAAGAIVGEKGGKLSWSERKKRGKGSQFKAQSLRAVEAMFLGAAKVLRRDGETERRLEREEERRLEREEERRFREKSQRICDRLPSSPFMY